MQINRATDYAVRVMIHLAMIPVAARVNGPALAFAIEAPESFISKVLQKLVQAGLIRSHRGTRGGFQLARKATDISLLEVVEAIEGPTQLNLCVPNGENCSHKDWCAAHPVWLEAQNALVRVLGASTIESLARTSASNLARLHHVAPMKIAALRKNKSGA